MPKDYKGDYPENTLFLSEPRVPIDFRYIGYTFRSKAQAIRIAEELSSDGILSYATTPKTAIGWTVIVHRDDYNKARNLVQKYGRKKMLNPINNQRNVRKNMNEKTAEEKGYAYTGIYERTKEEATNRAQEIRSKGYKAVLVEERASRRAADWHVSGRKRRAGIKRGPILGYAVYAGKQYFKDKGREKVKSQLDSLPSKRKAIHEKYLSELNDLEEEGNRLRDRLDELEAMNPLSKAQKLEKNSIVKRLKYIENVKKGTARRNDGPGSGPGPTSRSGVRYSQSYWTKRRREEDEGITRPKKRRPKKRRNPESTNFGTLALLGLAGLGIYVIKKREDT